MDRIVELTGSLMISGFSEADFFSIAVLAGFGTVRTVIGVALGVLQIVALWFILEKAKLPGWGAIIPFYNIYLFFKLAGHPYWTWWILFPPVLGILAIIAQFNIAERFWKGVGWGFGLWLIPIVFYPILAFGDAKYQPE